MGKSIAEIRKEMKRYFGSTKFTASFKKEYGLIEVMYYDFRIMEDVNKEISQIAGNDWEVDARCGIPYSEYIGGIVAEIERKRDLLVSCGNCSKTEISKRIYQPLFRASELLTKALK